MKGIAEQHKMKLLQAAYLIDAIVTAPLVVAVLTRNKAWIANLLGPSLQADPGSLSLIGSIWAALMICATMGLFFPVAMAPVLVIQLIYKGLWLVLFVLPRWIRGQGEGVSWRIAVLFVAYMATYPWVIPWSQLFARR